MVFISDVSASSDDIVYVLSSKEGTKVKDSDNTYYEYKAVVNGEITTVKMDEELKDSYPSGNVLKTDILLNVIAYADAENEILDASACEEYSKKDTDDTYQLPGVEVKARGRGWYHRPGRQELRCFRRCRGLCRHQGQEDRDWLSE